MSNSLTSSTTFRIDFLRWQFLVLCISLAAYVLVRPLQQISVALIAVGLVVAVGAAVALHYGILEIDAEGLTLYRTNRVTWPEVTRATEVTILGLPYLRLWRITGLPWLVPLYVLGEQSVLAALRERVPASSELGRFLEQLERGPPSPSPKDAA